jgi:hypothetical protein
VILCRLGTRAYIPTMPARKPRPADSKPQSEWFIETARALGCDEDEAAFEGKLAVIARYKPKENRRTTPPEKS